MTAENSGGDQRLEFGILGPLEVLRSGTRLKLGGRQQRAILGLLLCEAGQVVSVGRLADALWGEHLPSGFLTTVQTYVFHLRALLEPDRARGAGSGVLVTEAGGGYRLLAAAGSVDAVLFEDLLVRGRAALESQDPVEAAVLLDRALTLWRGEVLGDLGDFGFVAPVAGRLQELRLSAMELRMEAELSLGHHGTAVAELDRLVASHPLREGLHAERILALYRSGRQSEALAAYRQLRTTLAEELGIEPSPPLHALHSAVLAQDPALAWHPAASAPVAAAGVGTATDEGHAGHGTLEGHAGQERPTPPSLGGDHHVLPRAFLGRFGVGSRRRVVALWVAAVLLATGGSIGAVVWLAHPSSLVALAANSVGAVEPDGAISSAVRVGTDPTGLAFGGGSLWVANGSDGTVSRIDPATHAVIQTIEVGAAPEALSVTAGDVWVANFTDNTVSRINIATNKVADSIRVGTGPAAIGSGPSGDVWVANSVDNTIQRIDPLTDHPDKAIGVGAGPDGIAVQAGALWVANGRDGTVSRIDPKTGEEVSSPIAVGSGPKGIAISGDEVWVANQLSTSVTRINGSSGQTRTIEVGDGPGSVVAAGGAVWVSEKFAGVLTRIDQATDEVRRFSIGSSPRGLAAADGRVWVASGAFTDSKHAGGTLTVAAPSTDLPGSDTVDAAKAEYAFSAERLVYDGLVSFRVASGADSQVLVPDLALRVPQPSNGGRTYTFTLRSGIKYSTGRDVHASDFRLGVRRALTVTGGRPDYYAGIIGGQNCVDHPKVCDLSRGVVADDATRRVTFHLSTPDPEFLDKLTWSVHPTPPGTSLKEVTDPLPGTGPYMIVEYTKGKTFSLTRNPFFEQRSYAAQPAGYPDVIRWLAVRDTRAALAAVTSGRADVTQPLVSNVRATSALVSDFKVRYPGQVHSDLVAGTLYEDLNVTVPPFNNLKARQAVNCAVDRNTLVELRGGPPAEPTCQLLPPNFPGHSWYCPYTTGPAEGPYHGPDFAKAQKLVDESGTRGMSVTVRSPTFAAFPTFNAYFQQVLRQLGYKVTLSLMPDTDPTYEFLLNPHNHVQVQTNAWTSDFPLASSFYDAVVACGGVFNLTEYCNRGLDQRAAAATTLMATDPGNALRAWAEIDRIITDAAMVVPMFNPIVSTFVSARVGNYQSNQTVGALLSQLWVR
ncbi:MAG: ABC transporter substrate-binding protein [Dermatophilaceae bacterium]